MTTDPREDRLPMWAQILIRGLRQEITAHTERLERELKTLRPLTQKLKAHNEALTELLECAARGGHKTAKEIMDIIGSYSLELSKEEES